VRYNLGFQVYSVPVTRPVTQLLKSAAVAAFHDARWDQEQFNAEMNVMRLKLGRLEICAHGANGGSDHSGCSQRGGHDGADNVNHNGGQDCMEGRRRRSEDDEHVAHLNNGTGVALEAPSHVNAARAEAAPQAHARAHAPPQAAACDPNEDLLVVLLDGLPESVASGALSAANLSALTSSALDELIRPSWSAAAASEWERSLGKAWEAVPEHLRNSSDTCLTKHLPSQSDPLRRFCQSRSSKMLSDAMAWYERWLNTSI